MRLPTIYLFSALLGAVLGVTGGAYALSCAANGTQAELALLSTTVDGELVEGDGTEQSLIRYTYAHALREQTPPSEASQRTNELWLFEAE